MTLPLPRAVVFDLDGTLVDTAPDLTSALNWVLESEGREPLPEMDVRHMVGRGGRHLLMRGLAVSGVTASEAELDLLLPRFLAYYGDHVAERSTLFPGVEAALLSLSAHGVRLAVCTNKPIGLTEPLLAALGIDRHFQAILGGDSFTFRKPDPRHLLETLNRLEVAAAEAVMVGDSDSDVKAARGAGMPVIGVSFGYTETPIHELGVDKIIDHYDELLPALAGLRQVDIRS